MKAIRILFALGLLACVSSVLGQAPALARQSPFSGGGLVGAGVNTPALELRGITAGPGGARFWIVDRSTGTGAWAAVSESGLPFLVRAGDPDANTATVEKDGRVTYLRLKEAKVLSEPLSPAAQNVSETPERAYVMTARLPGEPRAPRPKADR